MHELMQGSPPFALVFFLGLWGTMCGETQKQVPHYETSVRELYFSSPQEAIPLIARLLQKEDFVTLSRYYDLSSGYTDLASLESGEFFIRRQPPAAAHPAGFWRYKHPFAPGFQFLRERPSRLEGVYVVEMYFEIDQGEGAPQQRGISLFYMRASEKGWQILPDPVDEPESAAPRPR